MKADWIPLRFLKLRKEDDWTVLYFESIEQDVFLRILTNQYVGIREGIPAYMLPWDRRGYTEIEFLDNAFTPQRIWGWRYATWFSKSVVTCLKLRRAQEDQTVRGTAC